MLKNHHFLIISLHFATICAFEVIYIDCLRTVEILYNDGLSYIALGVPIPHLVMSYW